MALNATVSVLIRGRKRDFSDGRGHMREAESDTEDAMYVVLEDEEGAVSPREM